MRVLEELLKANGIDIPPEGTINSSYDDPSEGTLSSGASISQLSGHRKSQQQPDPRGSPVVFMETEQPIVTPESSNSRNHFVQSDETGGNNEQPYPVPAWDSHMSQQTNSLCDMPPLGRPTNSDFAIAMSDTAWIDQELSRTSEILNNEYAVIVEDDNMRNSPAKMYSPGNLHSRPTTRRQSSIEWHDDNSWGNNNREVPEAQMVALHQSDEMVDQLSARMGAFQIAEDGQLRYFGATSNLHILHNGESSLSRMPTRSVHLEGNLVLQRAGLGREVPLAFEEHLEKLYFTWEDPAIHVVDEDMYFKEKIKYNDGESGTPFYSETLKNAMYV